MSKHKKLSLPFKIFVALLICFILATSVSLIEIAKYPEDAANFADNVLRPLFGSKAVITIEGIVFGVQDKINKAKNSNPITTNYTSNINEAAANTGISESFILIPPNIKPLVGFSDPLADEGIWKNIEGTSLYTTFVRTDPTRSFSVVNLVFIPSKNVSIGAVAGTKHPGGELKQNGTGIVPTDIQNSGKLIAAFNGGFQEKDGHYGMYANGITYVPMQNGLATVFIYKNGKVAIQKFDSSLMTNDVLVARQNGPLLIDNGQVSNSTSKGIALWAGTSAGDYVTWRSGLGITANGDLIYAVGPSLTPQSLGDALRLAGCTEAMQLDINNFWVRFVIFTWNQNGSFYNYQPLTKSLPNAGKQFLTGDEKDFFYLYTK